MDQFPIEQALFAQSLAHVGTDGGETKTATTLVPLGRSVGFAEDWMQSAEELIRGYGERPAGVRCPLAVFAHPFADQVAVVQVADQPDGTLAFHFLVLPRSDYEKWGGDPFLLARKLPADWQGRGTLPTHSWPCQPLPSRTVAQVRQVLQRLKSGALSEDWEPPDADALPADDSPTKVKKKASESIVSPHDLAKLERTVENSESPALLGATQVLVDGGRVLFRRPGPDTNLIEGLWTLLPNTTRCRLWPASFAFANHLQFDAAVVPRLEPDDLEGYTSEEQAIDYPEGRYELALQSAAENGDQQHLDSLLSRRSVWDTWRLGLCLLALMIGLVLIDRLLPRAAPPPSSAETRYKAKAAAMIVGVGANDPWLALAILNAGKKKIAHNIEE